MHRNGSLRAGTLALLLPLSGLGPQTGRIPELQRLATLAGDWSLLTPEGEASDLRASYRVIAGGAAVMETLFAGTAEETVTLYHSEGNAIRAMQLSARGTPRRLLPRKSKDRNRLGFGADGETAEPGQLIGLELTLASETRLRIDWTLKPDAGSGADSRTFELEREAGVAVLAAEVTRLRVSLESLQRELDRRLKLQVTVKEKGRPTRVFRETVTFPLGPGWNVSGEPLRLHLHALTQRFASTFASLGDRGMSVAHYGFKAGPGCKLRFSVLGGHGYIAVVEETTAPPRRIRSIPEFSTKLGNGLCGPTIERIVGGRWSSPIAVDWALSKFEGKSLRLYVVDAAKNHYGQIGISEVSIRERVGK